MIVEKGVTLLQCRAEEVQLSEGMPHVIKLFDAVTKVRKTLYAHWVVDSTGRRRLLHHQKHERRDSNGYCNAAWFRVPGWIDVEDFVSADNVAWHERVSSEHPRGIRFGRVNSTTHLSGTGYWVWLIPLPDNVMSVGIVAQQSLVPFDTYNSPGRMMDWLTNNEPQLAQALVNRDMLDFRVIRGYSHSVTDFISTDRWALNGNALGFVDPFYSPGGDMISLVNLIIVEAIRRERSGATLDEAVCQRLTENMRNYQSMATDAIQSIYPCLGASRVSGAHIVLDFVSLVAPMVGIIRGFGAQMYDFLGSEEASRILNEHAALRKDLNQLMLSWLDGDQPYQPVGSMFDHGTKMDEVISTMWVDPAGKDIAFLANHWLEGLKTFAEKYHTQGIEWDFFDPNVYREH